VWGHDLSQPGDEDRKTKEEEKDEKGTEGEGDVETNRAEMFGGQGSHVGRNV